MVMGDLNANLYSPRDERDQDIADAVDGAGFVEHVSAQCGPGIVRHHRAAVGAH